MTFETWMETDGKTRAGTRTRGKRRRGRGDEERESDGMAMRRLSSRMQRRAMDWDGPSPVGGCNCGLEWGLCPCDGLDGQECLPRWMRRDVRRRRACRTSRSARKIDKRLHRLGLEWGCMGINASEATDFTFWGGGRDTNVPATVWTDRNVCPTMPLYCPSESQLFTDQGLSGADPQPA